MFAKILSIYINISSIYHIYFLLLIHLNTQKISYSILFIIDVHNIWHIPLINGLSLIQLKIKIILVPTTKNVICQNNKLSKFNSKYKNKKKRL